MPIQLTKGKAAALTLILCQVVLMLSLLFGLLKQPTAVHAADWNVNSFTDASDGSCGDGTCSLRDAVILAAANDTIYLPAGSYLLASGLGQINVAKTLNFVGQGATAADTIIDGNSAIRLFNITTGMVTFSNLTLQNGRPANGNGGAILTSGTGSITLDNSVITNSVTQGNGGAIYLASGTLNIINGSKIISNTAVVGSSGSGGGVYSNNGPINLTDSTIASNTAQLGGGLTLNLASAQLTINNGQLLSNRALLADSFSGGAINLGFGSAIMHSGLISGNTAFRGAGAVVNSGSFTLNGGTITDNQSNYGGGVYVRNSTALLTINGGAISGNRSVATIFGGGALYIFQGKAVQNGGEINDNTAVNLGGAMEVRQGSFQMNGGTISGNSAGNWGGAIYNDLGFVTITNGTLTNNSSILGGGAIATGAASSNQISRSVIYSNSTSITQTGGAILNTGLLTLTNVTLSDNWANNGGGLQNQGTATLNNVTIYENTAVANGGGINTSGGTLNITNSIVAGNSASTGPDCAGTIVSQGYNLIQTSSGCTINGSTTGNLSGDPQLAALALNGGSTLNHAPGGSSPAVDAGNNASCAATDQRGIARPIDGNDDTVATCDIGAFELGIQIAIGDATVTEGNSGSVAATFIVTRSVQTSGTDSFDYATVTNTATAADFTAVPSTTLTFSPGEISKTITVNVLGDTIDEPTETFFVQLGNPSAGVYFSKAVGIGTILDDDGVPDINIADASVSEGNSGTKTASFTVTLSAASASTIMVNYATSNGTAVAPTDYLSANNTLTFSPGDTEEIITVTINGDTTDEEDETFLVTLSSPSNANLGDAVAQGTISNDDSPPSVSIANSSVTEGNSGTTTAVFTVTLSEASGKTVGLDYTTVADTAVSPNDFVDSSGSLSFAPGETEKTISVTVNGDLLDEEDETFLVNLSGLSNATAGSSQAIGTIYDDDAPPTISIADATVIEGNSGTRTAVFTVTLSQASSKIITVAVNSSSGTATAGVDYTAVATSLTFNPGGALSQTVSVTIHGDTLVESDETFWVTLSNPSNAVLGKSQATGTIINDDEAVDDSNYLYIPFVISP